MLMHETMMVRTIKHISITIINAKLTFLLQQFKWILILSSSFPFVLHDCNIAVCLFVYSFRFVRRFYTLQKNKSILSAFFSVLEP